MSIQAAHPTEPEACLRREGGGDCRWELVNGEAIRLPRDGTRRHMHPVMALMMCLHPQLDPARRLTCLFLLCVRTPASIRVPDLVVDANAGRGDELAACASILLAEVTSDWSQERDLGSKREDYLGIPSPHYYLVPSQETRQAWFWSRSEKRWEGPAIITDCGAKIPLPALEATLEPAVIYLQVFCTSGRGAC